MTKPWNTHRQEITDLYLRDGHRLEDVRSIMKERHGFQASVRAYRHHFDQWNVTKYNRKGRQSRRSSASSTQSRDTTSSADSPPLILGFEEDIVTSPELEQDEPTTPEQPVWLGWNKSLSPTSEPSAESPLGSFDPWSPRDVVDRFDEDQLVPGYSMSRYQSTAQREFDCSADLIDPVNIDAKPFYHTCDVPCAMEHSWAWSRQFCTCVYEQPLSAGSYTVT